jgi:hypothetical protein
MAASRAVRCFLIFFLLQIVTDGQLLLSVPAAEGDMSQLTPATTRALPAPSSLVVLIRPGCTVALAVWTVCGAPALARLGLTRQEVRLLRTKP